MIIETQAKLQESCPVCRCLSARGSENRYLKLVCSVFSFVKRKTAAGQSTKASEGGREGGREGGAGGREGGRSGRAESVSQPQSLDCHLALI